MPTLPEHLSLPPVYSEVRVTRSLVLCVCFVDRCLSFCTFFWPLCCLFFFHIRILITLWYLQTFRNIIIHIFMLKNQLYLVLKLFQEEINIKKLCSITEFIGTLDGNIYYTTA